MFTFDAEIIMLLVAKLSYRWQGYDLKNQKEVQENLQLWICMHI